MSIFSRKRNERRTSQRSVRAVERVQERTERRRREEAQRRAAAERKRQEEARRREAAAERKRQEEARKRAEADRRREERERRKPTPKPKPTATATVSSSPEPSATSSSASASATATASATASTAPVVTAEPTEAQEPVVTAEPTEVPDPVVTPEPTLHHRFQSQVDFSSDQLEVENPVTEFLQTPAIAVDFEFHSRDLVMDDGAEFEMWSFEDDQFERGFPGPTLRAQEGQVFHATVHPSKGPHTIHWHGMEPDPRNDGVGHTSFEVDGQYTYQMQPEAGRPGDPNYGAAGTYFYHCHVNTPLHVQIKRMKLVK